MNHSVLNPRMLTIANDIMQWAHTFLMAERPDDVRRPYNGQTVCPFVRASVQNDYFYLAFHPNIGADERLIEDEMMAYIDEFPRLQPFDPSAKLLKALLVVFPDIPKEHVNILDIVHSNIKTAFVERGLMVGQFHPKCKDTGIHNRSFSPSVAPHPLIAVRNMAMHDIVFLADGKHPEWFTEYNARFGDKFRDPQGLKEEEKALLSYYQRAREAFLKR